MAIVKKTGFPMTNKHNTFSNNSKGERRYRVDDYIKEGTFLQSSSIKLQIENITLEFVKK